MKKTKEVLVYLFKIIIAGIVAIGILSLFVLMYHNTGIHIANSTGATDYKWESKQYKSTMVEGFAWIQMDEDGFNNAYIPKKNIPDILLMGSSHMEAVQIGSEQNVAYQLNELLPDYYTYNIGMSGHTIYRCVANMQDALQTYQPQHYVIIETDEIALDTGELLDVVNGDYETIPSYDTGLIYYLQKIPSLKWIYKAIEEWISADSYSMTVFANDMELDGESDYEYVLNIFLGKARKQADDAGVELIIFYHPTEVLSESGEVFYDTDQLYLRSFEELCEKNDIIFIDMTESFTYLYTQNHKLGHGFDNTEVGSGHLNQYGHKVIAEKLCEIIKKQEEE